MNKAARRKIVSQLKSTAEEERPVRIARPNRHGERQGHMPEVRQWCRRRGKVAQTGAGQIRK